MFQYATILVLLFQLKSLSISHGCFIFLHKSKMGSFPPYDVCQNSSAVCEEESVFWLDFMVIFSVETLTTNNCQLHLTLKRSTNKVTEKVNTFHRGITEVEVWLFCYVVSIGYTIVYSL